MIALVNSHRLEDRQRNKAIEGLVTRAAAAKIQKTHNNMKIGPPNRKKDVIPKTVTVEERDGAGTPSENTKTNPKETALPYVDVPPLSDSLRSLINDRVKDAKIGPVYKSRAPVEAGLDIEKLVEQVLDLEISVPLRNLAGISGAIQKEIRKQVTKARIPIETEETVKQGLITESRPTIRVDSLPLSTYVVMNEPSETVPEGYLIADDPVLQYLDTHKEAEPGDLVVAEASEPLRAIYMTINRIGQEECLYDPGSMIVSMGRETAVQLGLTWDPSLRINMESASNHIEKTLGLARNVRFFVGGINVYLQVHILENPPYRVLLGRPFERFTACNSSTKVDGSSDLTLTDPNSKKVVNVPTYPRGQGPEEIQKQKYQSF